MVINLTFILLLLFQSCSLYRVYGMKKEDFMIKVGSKDYNFLLEVDYLKNSIKEINRLGKGASYYMSFVYKNNDMLLFSNKLLYQEIQNKDSYYGPKAATELLKQLLRESDYVKTEAHALDFMELYKGDFPDIQKQLIEALYWQKKDEQVVPYIDNLDRNNYSDYANNELDMLRTVSSARLGIPSWVSEYKSLFLNQPLSPLLARAYSFIEFYPEYANSFSSNEKEYFRAISLASSGSYSDSQEILRSLMYTSDWIFSTEQSIKNISRIIKDSKYISLNLDSFKTAMLNAPENKYHNALVSYASLYFNKESFSDVVTLLEDEIDYMSFGSYKDDAIWLYLLSLSHVDRERIVLKLDFYLDKISDKEYLTDIIEFVITALVQNREWDSILELKDLVNKYGSIEDQSRISWILSRVYYYKFLDSDNIKKSIEKELESIVIKDNNSYYSYIANAMLKRESNLILDDPDVAIDLNNDDKWIDGFLTYGLEDEALLYSRQVKDLNYNVSISVGEYLTNENKHLETLRFLSRAKVPLNKESFPLYYPLPYKDKIVEVADSYGFNATLYSGLIRTESGFDMDVVSSAGAVGLSQLMPATAEEMAYDIGIKNPDLKDPSINILLGGEYINWLRLRFYTYPISFMSYNAGPGNVWNWQKLWGDLPDELFIEAAPFKETRDYVPKIIKAAIYYGHEEYNISPYNVIKLIFKDID